MPAVFDGIRVLDLGPGLAGSLAAMVLADNGAEVFKVEPPGGDPDRRHPAWRMWNRGKKGVVVDLSSPDGAEQARRLAPAVDVVLESLGAGRAERLGVGYEALSKNNPGLVYCSVTALGSRGEHTDLPLDDGVFQAAIGGFMDMRGGFLQTDRPEPVYRARPQGSYGAANIAVQAIAGALRVRERTGRGQRVETSLFQGFLCYETSAAMRLQVEMGLAPKDTPVGGASSIRANVSLPYLVARCKDGQWMQLANNNARLFANFMKVLGLSDVVAKDPRFKGAPYAFERDEDVLALRDMVLDRMERRTMDEWLDLFIKHDCAGDRFLTTQQLMDHPQMLHIGGVVDVKDPEVGPTKQIGPLARFSATPSVIGAPAPRVGEHTAEAQRIAATLRSVAPRAKPNAPLPRHPFEGITLLDFSGWLAAPMGSSLIAEHGARVIRIEPLTGDDFRRSTRGMGRTFAGKENLTIDLKTAEGRAAIHKLITKADAVMHNMRADAPARVGIDYETVRKLNPKIVYLYAGSYGSTGPSAGRAAFHPIAGAMTGGVLWQLGGASALPPNDLPLSRREVVDWGLAILRANEGSPDVTSAIAVGTALAMALYARERTGQGQYVETAMLVGNAYLSSDDFIQYAGKAPRLDPDRYQRGVHALYRLYPTASGWVFLACPSQGEWKALCRAIGRPGLAEDRRFATLEARSRHDGALVAALAQAFSQRSADEWEASLRPQGLMCLRADRGASGQFFLTSPTSKANGFVAETKHPAFGSMLRHGPPATYSLTPGVAGPVHTLGQDTTAIMEEMGYSRSQIEDLRKRGVIGGPAAGG